MLLVLALLYSTALPGATPSTTSWMRPETLHLTIGMSRIEVAHVIKAAGLEMKDGRDENQAVLDFSGDRSLTLDFRRGRLRSMRFELFTLLDKLPVAFEEEKAYLRKELGKPRATLGGGAVVLYDNVLPNVMVVMSNDPKSENGRKGIGFVAVRYYDPAIVK
jgi:hypothetical protein